MLISTGCYLGDYTEDSTIYVGPFASNATDGSAVAPSSAFEAADVLIYKDGVTKKTTTNGLTLTSPFDSVTGLHMLEIDTSIDTGDIGFWATGSDYSVVLTPDETVDSKVVVAPLAQFSIMARLGIAASTWAEVLTLPGQEAPPLAPSVAVALSWLYKFLRNKKTQSATELALYDDAGTTVDTKAAVSEAAGIVTVNEQETGP